MTNSSDLEAAYALRTPEDSKRLYAGWAKTYDGGFAANMDYQLPAQVARAFVGAGGKGPVLDIGAGTGLAGMALFSNGIGSIDATDISPEMLAVAGEKGIYHWLFAGDMTTRLPVDDGSYAGVISSGTFTTGHVGPDALDEVLRVAKTGALIAISVSAPHFEAQGFAAKFESLAAQIRALEFVDVPVYGAANTSTHRGDMCRIALFVKA